MVQLLALFAWMMGAFVALAFLEATVEGEQGGAEGTKGWRKEVFGFRLKEYHFWLWWVVVPLLVFSPLLVTGPDPAVFGTLAIAYLIGGIVEDFVYFVVNPAFGLKKWNSGGAKWMPWFRVGRLEIPRFYVRNIAAAAAVWVLFFWF
jgi:hypothetical protein